MQVSFHFNQPKSNPLNTAGINNGLRDKQTMTRNKDGEIVLKEKQDRVTLSPQGKMMNMIQNLMEQKENVIQNRSDLVAKTLESGGTMDSIKVQMDLYEEQLDGIDEQISQLQTNMAKSLVEEAKESDSGKSDENKTAEQKETEQLSGLASVSDSLSAAKTISRVKTRTEGEARVKQSEIKMGELRIELLKDKAKGTTVNTGAMIANAERVLDTERDKVSALEQKTIALDTMQGGALADAGKELDDVRETAKAPENPDDAELPEEDQNETQA